MPIIAKAVGKRLLYGIPVLLVVTFGAACLSTLMPGSPARSILGDTATQEQIEALNHRYGYDEPILTRYWNWLLDALHGDFGVTLFGRKSVLNLVLDRLGVTAEIALLALLMALSVAVLGALYCAYRLGGVVDRVMQVVASVLLSVPSFVSVVVLSLIFSGYFGLFPATGWVPLSAGIGQNLHYALLPAISLATYEAAFFFRILRTDLVGTMREDFLLVARVKGLPRSYILFRHLLRPSLSSLTTVLGLSLGRLLGGAVIAETFFAVPGLGAEAISATSQKDLAVLQAIVVTAVVIYVLVFIIVDLAYAWVDPRVEVK